MFFVTNLVNLLSTPLQIVDLTIGIVLVVSIIVLLIIYFKKTPAAYVISGLLVCSFLFNFFGFVILSLISMLALVVIGVVFAFANISDLRHLLIKPQHKKKRISSKYNKDDLYRIIDDTVHSLSRSKTGAIMTFERSINLDDVMKSGTNIDAPVTQELLETIFYTGTRLHDGAVVIRDNIIVAASVYYTPTTRALTGKYGSRHRAAFGISEISDSITVVVSEETGRVSIAYNGSLESVPLDSFLREFSDLMSISSH